MSYGNELIAMLRPLGVYSFREGKLLARRIAGAGRGSGRGGCELFEGAEGNDCQVGGGRGAL